MANREQLELLRQGIDVWNRWRENNPRVAIDLNQTNLREAKLREANLSKANLTGADLSGADLSGAELIKANLRGANLIKTNLRGAEISEANLWGARLIGSSFSGAVAYATIFGNSDLSEAIGLEHVHHGGPSSISTDTIALSKGKIPKVFLRHCGLSDWEIESAMLYKPGLSNEEINKVLYKMYDLRAGQALQISPLFISYSHDDGKYVDKLESQLNKKGVRFWRDIHDAKAGRLEK